MSTLFGIFFKVLDWVLECISIAYCLNLVAGDFLTHALPVILQARKYIMDSMGEKYAEGVILDLEKTWEESDPRTPLICFLSMGSDPTDSIIVLGKRLKIETRYVSMGQGQEVHARKLLQQTMANVSPEHSITVHTDWTPNSQIIILVPRLLCLVRKSGERN